MMRQILMSVDSIKIKCNFSEKPYLNTFEDKKAEKGTKRRREEREERKTKRAYPLDIDLG